MLDNFDEATIKRHIASIQQLINEKTNNSVTNRRGRKRYLKKLRDEIAFWEWQIQNPDKRKNIHGITMENCPVCNAPMKKSLKKFVCSFCGKRYIKTDGSLIIAA